MMKRTIEQGGRTIKRRMLEQGPVKGMEKIDFHHELFHRPRNEELDEEEFDKFVEIKREMKGGLSAENDCLAVARCFQEGFVLSYRNTSWCDDPACIIADEHIRGVDLEKGFLSQIHYSVLRASVRGAPNLLKCLQPVAKTLARHAYAVECAAKCFNPDVALVMAGFMGYICLDGVEPDFFKGRSSRELSGMMHATDLGVIERFRNGIEVGGFTVPATVSETRLEMVSQMMENVWEALGAEPGEALINVAAFREGKERWCEDVARLLNTSMKVLDKMVRAHTALQRFVRD